jgi:hypothetical protein
MSSRRSRIRKRERQKRRYKLHPKQIEEPISHIKTAGLIAALAAQSLSSRAFDEALREAHHTEV